MLQPVNQAGATSSSSKQITAAGYANGTVLYTVPSGKTFTGVITAQTPPGSTAAPGSVVINNWTVYVGATPVPLTLVGGTVVKLNNSYVGLVGVEQ